MEKYFFATDRSALLDILATGVIEGIQKKPGLHGEDGAETGRP